MRLLLVRHGDAHAGFHGVIGGETGCTGLTDLGHAQARALRDHVSRTSRFQADVLVASTLRRAVETAEAIAPGFGLEVSGQDRDLCEVHTGEADGLTWAEYATRYGTFDMVAEPDRTVAPEGDSWNSFHDRVERVLHRLADEHPDQTVVAVCHAGVIMASLRMLLPITEPLADVRPSNTGVTEWEHDPERERWILHGFNDTAHLLDLGEGTAPPVGEPG